MHVLDCYGKDAPALSAISGSFDPTNDVDALTWWLGQWERIAERMGWRSDFVAAVTEANESPDTTLRSAPLVGFQRWHKARSESLAVAGPWNRNELGRAQYAVVRSLREQPGIWRLSAASFSLPGGACTGRFRVLPSAARPTYFDEGLPDATPRGSCEWSGEVRVYFGTWPWFAGRLEPVADGLTWPWRARNSAASLALKTAGQCFEPQFNATVDARDVQAHWQRFTDLTAPVLASLPTTGAIPGALYRDGYRIRAHLGSTRSRYLNGPRGPISLDAYNFVVERFAAFWACREAIIRNAHRLPKIRSTLAKNPDPCVHRTIKPKPVQDIKAVRR